MRFWMGIGIFLASFGVVAESNFPEGCVAIPVSGESMTIKAQKNHLFLIHNTSDVDVWITHPIDNPGASAGWTTRLQSEHWSALVLEKTPFVLNCIESRPGHEQQVPCEGVIVGCQWKDVKLPAESKGSFWAVEDLKLPALTAALGGRGFKLPEAP